MCLLLGPPNVGKSVLLEKLKEEEIFTKSKTENSTKPVIKKAICNYGKKNEMCIIEPEKSSFVCWTKYLTSNCAAILFMIDSTNRKQISDAIILLLKVLSFPATNNVPMLILLNKCDRNDSMTRVEVENYFHLKDVVDCSTTERGRSPPEDAETHAKESTPEILPQVVRRHVNVLECSSTHGTGLPLIVSWLQQNAGHQ